MVNKLENSTTQKQVIYDLSYAIDPLLPGGKTRWVQIGAMFEHKEGNGFNIVIDSLPVNFTGRVSAFLREEKPTSSKVN